MADRNDRLDAVVDVLIGFICDTGIAGADVNFNLEVGKRLDGFAVDVGDGVVFVSLVNEDIMNLLGSSLRSTHCILGPKKTKIDPRYREPGIKKEKM